MCQLPRVPSSPSLSINPPLPAQVGRNLQFLAWEACQSPPISLKASLLFLNRSCSKPDAATEPGSLPFAPIQPLTLWNNPPPLPAWTWHLTTIHASLLSGSTGSRPGDSCQRKLRWATRLPKTFQAPLPAAPPISLSSCFPVQESLGQKDFSSSSRQSLAQDRAGVKPSQITEIQNNQKKSMPFIHLVLIGGFSFIYSYFHSFFSYSTRYLVPTSYRCRCWGYSSKYNRQKDLPLWI